MKMEEDSASRPAAKCWCFTKHYGGPGQASHEEALAQIENLFEHANYVVTGDEVAPTTLQKHFQGYAQFERKLRLSQLVKWVSQCHWTIARGSDQDNFNYCSKGGKFSEVGERRDTTGGAAGKAATEERWKRARTAAVMNQLADVPDDIYVKSYAAICAIAKDNMKLPADAGGPTGLWIYGPSGSGKSRKAREDYPGAYFKLANKWWDGYHGEEAVILDDFDKVHSVLGYHLKIWADRYAFIGEVKGGAVPARPKHFVVTSNYSPEDIWQDKETLDPIRRRFKVIHMLSPEQFGFVTAGSAPVPAFNMPGPAPVTVSRPEVVDLCESEDE